MVVIACMVLHNFIHEHDSEDSDFAHFDRDPYFVLTILKRYNRSKMQLHQMVLLRKPMPPPWMYFVTTRPHHCSLWNTSLHFQLFFIWTIIIVLRYCHGYGLINYLLCASIVECSRIFILRCCIYVQKNIRFFVNKQEHNSCAICTMIYHTTSREKMAIPTKT